MAILENLGLNEEILQKGTVVEGADMHWNQEFIGGVSMDAVDPKTRYPFPFVLPQSDVEEAFEHVLNAREGKVEREHEVVKIETWKEYVEVTLKSGEVIKAKYVVGCDGAHSSIRHSQADWKFEGRPVNVLWAQCDGTISDPKKHTTKAAFYIGGSGTHPTLLI
jgi:2-polyprenyl-6-methoxyphenol hydroxylase-like FAD-dependent oxidoreductase